MSQQEVYSILKELGGKATSGEISKKAKDKFPGKTLHLYISVRMKQLVKSGAVKKEDDKWVIAGEPTWNKKHNRRWAKRPDGATPVKEDKEVSKEPKDDKKAKKK